MPQIENVLVHNLNNGMIWPTLHSASYSGANWVACNCISAANPPIGFVNFDHKYQVHGISAESNTGYISNILGMSHLSDPPHVFVFQQP